MFLAFHKNSLKLYFYSSKAIKGPSVLGGCGGEKQPGHDLLRRSFEYRSLDSSLEEANLLSGDLCRVDHFVTRGPRLQ